MGFNLQEAVDILLRIVLVSAPQLCRSCDRQDGSCLWGYNWIQHWVPNHQFVLHTKCRGRANVVRGDDCLGVPSVVSSGPSLTIAGAHGVVTGRSSSQSMEEEECLVFGKCPDAFQEIGGDRASKALPKTVISLS